MSQSNLGSKGQRCNIDNDDSKRKRRTRNDEDGRNFSCNCGKSYLSYPALYTHVKTKHNGKPQFTKLANYSRDSNESGEQKQQQEVQSVEKVQDNNNIQLLKKYLCKFFPLTQKEKDQDKRLRQLSKDEQAFLKSIKEYWDKHKKEDEPHQNQTFATPIDYVIGKFLLDMESDISRSGQKYLADFAINIRNSINEIKGSEQYCKNSNCSQIPSMMNDLFTQKFQKMQQGHLYIRHPTIICKTLYHFNRWLFNERYTNLLLKFNTV